MNENKVPWASIGVVVVLVGLGIWWYSTSNSATPADVSTNDGAVTDTSDTVNVSINTVDRVSSTVASIAESISGASTFGSWLVSTGVASQITGKGPYTIFVPTDKAVAALKAGTFNNLSTAEQKRFVQYHIISGRALDIDAMQSGTIVALSKDALNFSNTNNIPMVNSGIVITQYKGSNGIVYEINTVLVPPKKQVI